MQQVEAFRASDGQLFETAELCQEHEVFMVWRSRIGEFVASDWFPYKKTGAPTRMAEKVIVAWEAFKESHKGDIARVEGHLAAQARKMSVPGTPASSSSISSPSSRE